MIRLSCANLLTRLTLSSRIFLSIKFLTPNKNLVIPVAMAKMERLFRLLDALKFLVSGCDRRSKPAADVTRFFRLREWSFDLAIARFLRARQLGRLDRDVEKLLEIE